MIIPDDMIEACGKVFAGEYDVNYSHGNPTILDIGANVGAFTRWARYRWPYSVIHAYEPLPDCISFLQKNTEDMENVTIHQCAVSSESGTSRLYYGTSNRGMSSLSRLETTRDHGVDVEVAAAASLPEAHIVKCDTEGAEVDILTNLSFDPSVVLVEYHSMENRSVLENFYSDKYYLVEYQFMSIHCGTMKFINKSCGV